jgi:hypothetical protein
LRFVSISAVDAGSRITGNIKLARLAPVSPAWYKML